MQRTQQREDSRKDKIDGHTWSWLAFECNGVIQRGACQRKQRAAGYRIERSLLGCFAFSSKWDEATHQRPRADVSVEKIFFGVPLARSAVELPSPVQVC